MDERALPALGAGSIIAGRYELASMLGQGGFGTVYKAKQRGTGQWVALKVLRPSADRGDGREARFRRELGLTARLNHPHVIRLLDSGVNDDGQPYIVFDYVDGADLTQVLATEGPLAPDETKRLMLQVLDGLSAAHALGMVHRDVKPRNIMISRTGLRRNALLLDFGIAGVVAGARTADYATITRGEVVSTPMYAAPEMLRGEQLTPQSDLYAWGLVFLECLSGEPVMKAPSVGEIVLAQVGPRPVPIPEMLSGHPLGAILRRATAKSLDERARSAEIYAALEACDVSDLGLARRGAPEGQGASPTGSTQRTLATTESRTRGATTASSSTVLRPMVGRSAELGLLLDRWQQVTEGRGQVALVTGEAGIGKSRFVRELKARLELGGRPWVECRCAPENQSSSLGMIIELLERWLDLSPAASASARLDALEALLHEHGFPLPETVPLFAALLSLPFEPRYAALELSPPARRQKTLEAIAALIAARAERTPQVFVIEDLHWADPSTLDLITLLLPHAEVAPILLVLTARPTFMSPWSGSLLLHFRLKPLTNEQGRALLAQVAPGASLSPELREKLLLKASGVPLFLEELARMVVERGESPGERAEDRLIPDTLRGSLDARLERLGPARETAQLAAALGAEFSHALLRAVSPLDDAAFEASLSRLVGAELLHCRGVAPAARYTFKHRLIQDAAYDSLPASTRRAHHGTIARVLEERASAREPARPELLAHHLHESGQHARALSSILQAGQAALQRSANQEAIAHAKKGLAWSSAHAEGRERQRQELALHGVLLPALFASRGYSSPEVEQVLAHARALCSAVGDTPQSFTIAWGLWVCYVCQGNHADALALARELLAAAERAKNPDWITEAHVAMGHSYYYFPDLALGCAHMESALSLCDPSTQGDHAVRYGQDPSILGASFLGIMEWLRGNPDRAFAVHEAALARAERLAHPYSENFIQGLCAVHRQLRQEPEEAFALAGVLIERSTRQGYPFWTAIGHVFQGWARVKRGERSLDQIRDGIASFLAIGARNNLPYYLLLRAECEATLLGPAPALASLDETEKLMNRTEERRMEADLHRLRGSVLLARDGDASSGAEACFHRAIEVARAQGARSLELRATLALCRLWRGRGRTTEAKTALAAIYGSFTEGFDAPDQVAARQLLGEL